MPSLQEFCDAMRWAADSDQVGYSQSDRDSLQPWDFFTDGLFNTDCSILGINALKRAGFDTGWATYSGNLSDALCAHGWVRLSPDVDLEPGDILLNDSSHVAVWLGDCIAQASIDENGNIAGGARGDQTGWEVNTCGYYDYPWDCILRYEGEDEEPAQDPGDPVNDAGLFYRVHSQDLGWLTPVHDGQTAGTTGFGLRMEALKITPPEGWELYVKVHVQNRGWMTYKGIKRGESSEEGSSETDPIIGTVGLGQRVEDIIVGVSKRPEGDTRQLRFQVHQQDAGWKSWTKEGYASGTDGMGLRLEAIRMVID